MPSALAQNLPAETIHILTPSINKAAGKVSIPGAFWDPHVAVWLDVAFCGRPSDFLHETLVCSTTTRGDLEKALRAIGCRDGDAWTDSIKTFRLIRGDRLLITVDFMQDGKPQTYSLDELLTLQSEDINWGGALGPFGFMFKGDPGNAPGAATSTAPETAPGLPPATGPEADDAGTILRDDPQIAMNFKGIQNPSQSFADHPLAYDDWPANVTLRCGRNYAVLPQAVFDSNGKIPITITFQKVTEEQLLTTDAKLWHDDAYRKYMLERLPIARQIDQDKAAYLDLRDQIRKLRKAPVEVRDAAKEKDLDGHSTLLAARIAMNYAALDRDWATWTVDHGTFSDKDPRVVAQIKAEAADWKEHMTLEGERTVQLATAEEAAYGQEQLEAGPQDAAVAAKLAGLRGREIEARSRAALADNQQERKRWQGEKARLDAQNNPQPDSRDVWRQEVTLRLDLCAAHDQASNAGIAYGQALQAAAPPANLPALEKTYAADALQVQLIQARLDLLSVDFEISKRKDMPGDPDLPDLQKQHDQLTQKIAQLQSATTRP